MVLHSQETVSFNYFRILATNIWKSGNVILSNIKSLVQCNDCLEDSQTTQRWALQWTDFTHRSTNAVLMVLQPCEKHNLLNKRIWQAQKKLLKLQVLLYYRIFCSKEVFFCSFSNYRLYPGESFQIYACTRLIETLLNPLIF